MGGWVKMVKGLSKSSNNNKHNTHTDNSMIITREKRGRGKVEEDKWGINGDGRRHNLGG